MGLATSERYSVVDTIDNVPIGGRCGLAGGFTAASPGPRDRPDRTDELIILFASAGLTAVSPSLSARYPAMICPTSDTVAR